MDIKKILNYIDILLPFITVLVSIGLNLLFVIQIPYVSQKFHWSVSLAIYGALSNLIFKLLLNFLQTNQSEINLLYSSTSNEFLKDHTSRITFKDDKVDIFVKVVVNGSPKKLLSQKITLVFPKGISIQKKREHITKYEINKKENTLSIDLSQIFNNKLKNTLGNHSIELSFTLLKKDRNINSPVETRLEKESWHTKLNCNELFLLK